MSRGEPKFRATGFVGLKTGLNLAHRLRDKIRTLKFQKRRLRMIHHFADLLDRKDDYWAMVLNRERFAFALNGPVTDKQSL